MKWQIGNLHIILKSSENSKLLSKEDVFQVLIIAWLQRIQFFSRGVVRLSTPGGQESNISSIFPHSPRFFLTFPQFFSIFFLNLGLRMGGPPTWEGPGYATVLQINFLRQPVAI